MYEKGTKLVASNGLANDYFGRYLAASADGLVMVVGAYGRDNPLADQGCVYTYDWNGSAWIQRGSHLTAGDAAVSDGFGVSVALSGNGNILAVGSFLWEGTATDQGGVYIFDRSGTTWVQRGAVLTAADAAVSDDFGIAVALSADGLVLVVSAPGWEGAVTDQGGVYTYDWSGSAWVQRGSVLTAPDAKSGDFFGACTSLSADGNVLAVGAHLRGGSYNGQGSVYIFDRSGSAWVIRGSVLIAPDPSLNAYFGLGLALAPNAQTLAVGSFGRDNVYVGQGAVYLFDWSGSNWLTRGPPLTNSDATTNDNFGVAMAFLKDNTTLMVGAGYKNLASGATGCVYTFTMASLTLSLSENLAAVNFIARSYSYVTGRLIDTKIVQAPSFTLAADAVGDPCYITIMPEQGQKWKSSTVYALNDLIFPTDTEAKPYYYQRISAGTSGATEPNWPTTPGAQVTDGAVTNAWQLVAELTHPISRGPLIAV